MRDANSEDQEAGGDAATSLMHRAAEAAGLAAYDWDIASDAISWSGNASAILGCDSSEITSGRRFASRLDPDNLTNRYDAVMQASTVDAGNGVGFRIEYRFLPDGRKNRKSLWLEDQGRWHAGPDGRPTRVLGTLRRIDERHKRDQQLSFLGKYDPLTGMMNRGRMMETLGGAMLACERDDSSCAFLVAAINNLAVVNEAYGFEVADEVIIEVGQRLARVVRAGDAVARYSGSKFGLVLHDCTASDLSVAAERFLRTARETVIDTARGPVWALLSIGAVVLPRHANDPSTAVARAEEALTEARRQPADEAIIYQPSQERLSRRTGNARNATEIVRCLKERRFQLAYQPVVDAATGTPAFHEALLRMTGEDGTMLTAGHLIPVAETLGLVRLIDREVTSIALDVLNRHPDARLSLNMSGTTATDPRWFPEIISLLTARADLARRLTIEITETVALGDLTHTIRFVDELRALGCRVAIDDFGAGYTSFRSLRALPIEFLKLDGTFCRDLSGTGDNPYYVRALIDLARSFGIKTVAEWVETEDDAQRLREWGIDLMQGKLFGMATLTPPWPATPASTPAPPAVETVDAFERDLDGELAKLRRAITLLDSAFAKRSATPPHTEPSLADLVSDTARRRAR
ncbi:EAL domain-containing protein [Aestuariivirga sp.]|uniref:EAL domain-containing protein n=1 Tax=Aestuariivirga sp. TaxID=2650926 RepID=UPI003784DACF